MGNAMSCFDRWGKRTPDGALFVPKSSGASSSKTPSAFANPSAAATAAAAAGTTAAATDTAAAAKPKTPVVAPSNQNAAEATSKSAASVTRTNRRRQTYSSNAAKAADTEMSSLDDGDDFGESEEDEELTTSDVHQRKLLEYRRNLTKVAKLKTHLFNATVKVTCSKDGKEIEWYKGHNLQGGKKPIGSIPVDKITSVKSQADNPKCLTISVNNPSPATFSFTFKTKEERVSWQEQLESFQKFMAMI